MAARSPWSVSLRELLIFVTLIALSCVSIKFANHWVWLGIATTATLLFMGLLVVAFVDRASRQAFAIGFVLFSGMYAAALLVSGPGQEFDPYSGVLPTTKLMKPVFEAVVTTEYVVTGSPTRYATQPEAFRASWANKSLRNAIGNGILGFENPKREDFVGVSHIWWGLMLGFCGGRFAKLVFLRREERMQGTSLARE